MMRKANLLLVVTKLELGGAQTNVLDLAAGIDRSTFNPFLFTCRDGLLMREASLIPGLSIHRSAWLDRPIDPLKDLFACFELRDHILRNRIDIVHTHSSKAGIIGRFAARLAGGRAICHTVHGWSFNDFQPAPVRRFCQGLERAAARESGRLICVSRYDRDRGLALGIGEEKKYRLIPYGIDTARFSGQGRKREGSLVIGTVACFKPQKAPLDFVRLASLVCREIPQAVFMVAGDGVLRPAVERRVRRLGLEKNVVLCGWRRDIPEFLSSLDVFCLSSLWEGLPIAVIEAMASGLPAVCTDTGGVRELVREGENGFIVSRHDMNAAAAAVIRLLRDPALRERMGARAAEAARGFGKELMLAKTQELYHDLIDTYTKESA
jgi:glycosyltransferase involved in cell wall biosynthesis